jgi:hypothetical protein
METQRPTIIDQTAAMPDPVATTIQVSEQQHADAADIGSRYARTKFERADCARSYALILGTDPTLAQWEALRTDWIRGYVEEHPDNAGGTADAAWSDFAQLLKLNHGLEKPRSTSAAATKKAAERESKRKATLAAHAGRTTEQVKNDLAAAFQTLATDPMNKNAAAAVKNLQLVLKDRTKDEQAEQRDEIAGLRKEIRGRLGRCDDVATLYSVLAALDDWAETE